MEIAPQANLVAVGKTALPAIRYASVPNGPCEKICAVRMALFWGGGPRLCGALLSFAIAERLPMTTMTFASHVSCAPDQRRARRAVSPAMARLAAALLALWTTATPAQNAPQLALQRVELTAGMHRIDAQVAQTPQERQIGLMHRQEMPTQEGMLFIFDQPGVQCFWMKNTLLPLTAAFVADDGTIVNLADMKPQTTDSHCSTKPVRYVLEMNQGWFGKKGIKAGFKLGGAPFSKR